MTKSESISPPPSVVGVVPAGGASRRMGRDKALLTFEGQTLAQRAARKLAGAADEVILADRGRGVVPGLPSVPDGPGAGPAAALLGAAAARPTSALLVLACDLPHVPARLLRALAVLDGEADLVLPRSPRGLEPLCALYRPPALAALERQVAAGDLALHSLVRIAGLRVRIWEFEEWQVFGEAATLFTNWNRPGDLIGETP